MSFYTDMQATTAELLAEFGAPVVLNHADNGDYDVDSGAPVTKTTTSTGTAVRIEYELKDIDGTQIRHGDVRLLIAAQNFPLPDTGDDVVFDGIIYSVVSTKPLSPAGIVMFYDTQARIG